MKFALFSPLYQGTVCMGNPKRGAGGAGGAGGAAFWVHPSLNNKIVVFLDVIVHGVFVIHAVVVVHIVVVVHVVVIHVVVIHVVVIQVGVVVRTCRRRHISLINNM